MDQFPTVLVAIITSFASVGGAALTARTFGRLGIAPAQVQLSETLQSTMQAQATEIASLTRQLTTERAAITGLQQDFAACKRRLERLEKVVASRAIGDTDDA